jgi:prephenate dehydratase
MYLGGGRTTRHDHPDLHAYLGPEGTFTESALRAVVPEAARRISTPSIVAALDAVRYGTVADATVPWENSTAGTVAETIRGLALGEPLIVRREVVLPVELVLAAPSGTALSDVTKILSHQHALVQAEPWLAEVSPVASRVSTRSTARAAEAVAQELGAPGHAAVCSEATAGMYGLEVIARPPAGAAPAATRFVVVGKTLLPAPISIATSDTAHERTTMTLLLYLPVSCGPEHAAAALKEARLGGHRTDRNVTDLAKGQRCICVHIPGERPASVLRRVLPALRRRGINIRHLGRYPAANPAEFFGRPHAPIVGTKNS